MRVHKALWVLAETSGNDRARKYAQERKTLSSTDRVKRDTQWLRRHGGTRLRDLWLSIPLEDRHALLEKHPDTTFPGGTDGVLDERSKLGRQSSARSKTTFKSKTPVKSTTTVNVKTAHKSAASSKTKVADMTNFEVGTTAEAKTTSVLDLQRPLYDDTTDSMLMLKTKLMMKACSNYHDVASKEYLLRMKTNYDRGSLSGVIQATVHSVKHAVLLSRSKDKARTADEAFSAVCNRLTDVFDSAL
ncbi:hypothetical protein PF010_g27685 [Phytophthora fragariae]|nr:hypothetical protein PF010_g27685 [Phytophthora fragariae]